MSLPLTLVDVHGDFYLFTYFSIVRLRSLEFDDHSRVVYVIIVRR